MRKALEELTRLVPFLARSHAVAPSINLVIRGTYLVHARWNGVDHWARLRISSSEMVLRIPCAGYVVVGTPDMSSIEGVLEKLRDAGPPTCLACISYSMGV